MMYDDLIELMRYCANDNPVCEKSEICPFYNQAEEDYGYYFCVERMLKQAADAIENLQKKLQKSEVDNINLTGWLAEEHAKHLWIPVAERLPEIGQEVLVWSYGDINVYALIQVDERVLRWRDNDGYYQINEDKEFWMSLPEPPKDGDG